MRYVTSYVCGYSVFCLILLAMPVTAVVEEVIMPEAAVQDKIDQEFVAERTSFTQRAEQQAKMETARNRADKLHNLPPEQVARLVRGSLREEDIADEEDNADYNAEDAAESVQVKTKSGGTHIWQFILSSMFVIVSGFLLCRQKRVKP